MSLKAITYVLSQIYDSASQKLLMVTLADIADDEGVSFSGVKYLTKKHNGITTRTASKLLAKLEADGHVTIIVGAGVDYGTGKTNRYFMTAYRDTLNLSTPKVGTRADQLVNQSNWVRPVKSDTPSNDTSDESSDSNAPVINDTSDLSSTTGQPLSSMTDNPSLLPPRIPVPPSNDDGADAPPVRDNNKLASIFMGIYLDEQAKIIKTKTGHKDPTDRGTFRGLHYKSFKGIADHALEITIEEFREYLTFVLASEWFKRRGVMPDANKIGAKIVLRVANNRGNRIQSKTDTTSETSVSWSNYTTE